MSLPIPESTHSAAQHKSGHLIRLLAAATGITLVSWIGWQIHQASERRIEEPQHVVLIDADLLPPPPEPIKKIEQQEIEEESVEITDDTEDSPPDDSSSVDDLLGLDASADAGADSFGLKAKRGGHSLIDLAGINARLRYKSYFDSITSGLKAVIDGENALRSSYYTIEFYLWLDHSGSIDHIKILTSSANSKVNTLLEHVLLSSTVHFAPPPQDLRQPMKLRLLTSPMEI